MDDDWHSGNVIITESGYSRIDPGSINLQRPSEEELKALGNSLGRTFLSVQSQEMPLLEDISSAFLVELRLIKENNGTIPSLLRRFQKSLLVAAEYARFFKPGDLEWLLPGLMRKAHPAIISALTRIIHEPNSLAQLV